MKGERFWALVGIGVALVSLALFVVANVASHGDGDTRDGQLCIIEELQEHRVNSYDADRDLASSLRAPFNVPREAPKFDERLEGACKRFLAG